MRLDTVEVSDLSFQLTESTNSVSAYSTVNLQIKPRLICGWIRRACRLNDSLTRAILLCFVPTIDLSRRAAASANAWKPLSSYSRFGRVNGITRPFKGRKSNYVISWLQYAEEAAAILDDGVSDRIGDGWRTVLRREDVDRRGEYRSKTAIKEKREKRSKN